MTTQLNAPPAQPLAASVTIARHDKTTTAEYRAGGEAAGVDERIAWTVRSALLEAFPRSLRALILTGSLARNEGTWLRAEERAHLAGDAEFIVVFAERAALPAAELMARLARAIGQRLYEQGIAAHIGLSPVRPDYLRALRPHIFAYELLAHGRVIWGERDILGLARRFAPTDIPLDDGFALLMNRIIELLESLCNSGGSLCEPVRYCVTKLWLDMATSFLLFKGQYESTYQLRAERLAAMAAAAECAAEGSSDPPIPFDRFNQRVSRATGNKLGRTDPLVGGAHGPTGDDDDLAALVNDAHAMWRWQLGQLTAVSGPASDDDLLKQWFAAQALGARMRGWAATAKRQGPLASMRALPRWARLAMRGSPRRLIYASASQLLFALPAILAGSGWGAVSDKERLSQLATASVASCDLGAGAGNGRYRQWARNLPLRNLPLMSEADGSWLSLSRETARNYHVLLEATRS